LIPRALMTHISYSASQACVYSSSVVSLVVPYLLFSHFFQFFPFSLFFPVFYRSLRFFFRILRFLLFLSYLGVL
jgi:hypothetical protein